MAFASIGVVLLSAAYFVPSAYRKAQMDKEVDRLCKADGGLKVYERVLLSADQFNSWGDPNVPNDRQGTMEDKSLYVIKNLSSQVVSGDVYGRWEATLNRFHYRAVRRSDSFLLGESISYGRFGGDVDGPWHPSNYIGCTGEWNAKILRRAVFFREKQG